MKKRLSTKSLSLALLTLALGACQPEEDKSGGVNAKESFPLSLAVASPTEYQTAAAGTPVADLAQVTDAGAPVSAYEDTAAKLTALLEGDSMGDCKFDPAPILTQETNAACYGPQVAYSSHPFDSSSGNLPTGDLGLWIATDSTSGHACAAAQLNARMQAVGKRTNAALFGLASMVCVANAKGLSADGDGKINLTSAMNDLAIPNTTFTSVSLTKSDGKYSYQIAFTLNSQPVAIEMEHSPGSDDTSYSGRLAYRATVNQMGGNCGVSSATTDNGSLVYKRSSATAMQVEARLGQYCGSDVSGLDANGVVDVSKKYDSGTEPNGWANNFNIFTASFDPSSLDGNYVFAWQAGMMDNAARTFNANVSTTASTTTVKAYFGFGSDIASTDGSIKGMICNWAGPGNNHTPVSLAQYQQASLNAATGKFDQAVASNISYAPANDCTPNGTFMYDTNLDGTPDTVAAGPHGLKTMTDANSNGHFDEIEADITLPSAPTYP